MPSYKERGVVGRHLVLCFHIDGPFVARSIPFARLLLIGIFLAFFFLASDLGSHNIPAPDPWTLKQSHQGVQGIDHISSINFQTH